MDAQEFAGEIRVSRNKASRAELEDDLEKNRRFLESIVENIPNMIFVKDAEDLRFTLFNKAAGDLLGLDIDAMIGKNDFDFFPAQQARFFTAKDRCVLEEKKL